MIIVNSIAGQRSNRLVTIAHAMATAIERRGSLRLTAFDAFKDDYHMDVQWGGKVITGDSKFWEMVRLVIAAFKRIGWKGLLKGRIVSDWSYRDRESLGKHEDLIRAFFQPRNIQNVVTDVDNLKKDGETLVGVHVRRGDYKDFEGGRYYYEDDVYECNKMRSGLNWRIKGIKFVF